MQYFGANIGKKNRICFPIFIYYHDKKFKNLTIGNNCHIGKDVLFDLGKPIIIGDNVTISMRTSIITHIDVGDSSLRNFGYQRESAKVTIGNNVYLGCGVTVLPEVSIGDNTLIGAGSIVVSDIPPNSVAVGTPAKAIKILQNNA